jgi:hypothetical protein
MKLLTVFLVFTVVFVAARRPLFAQAPPAATLTCAIEQPLDAPSGTPVTYDVSNMGYLVMDAAIDIKGGNIGDGIIASNPPSGSRPSTYLVITATNSTGTSVPVHAQVTGSLGGTGGYQITFFLPEDATTRTTKEQAFIDNAKATDTTSPASTASWVGANNAQALAAVDKIYTQSQVGAFTITVQFVSTQPGLWNGTVTGTSIIANIENKGSILDSVH